MTSRRPSPSSEQGRSDVHGSATGTPGESTTPHGTPLDGKDSALAARATGNSWKSSMLRYYSLTKPRVLYGNVLTAAAGFLFASSGRVNWLLFLAVCLGTTLIIGSACVLNNVLDRDIDTVMARTRNRATVTGGVGARHAVIYSTILGVAGLLVLLLWTNLLVLAVGIGGFLAYVVLYGMLAKRMSIHGTLVGSISGAAPVLGGYVGASNVLDAGAAITFLMMFFWQMPAFYSIAVYRRAEYARAQVPVITVVRSLANTKVQILVYTVVFVVLSLLPQLFGLTGWAYTTVMALLGAGWIVMAVRGLLVPDSNRWAHQMFRYALTMMCAISLMLSIGPRLP